MQQLELFASPAPLIDTGGRTPEQEAAFQSVLAEGRREVAEFRAFRLNVPNAPKMYKYVSNPC